MDLTNKPEDSNQRILPENATRIPSRRERKRATDRESQRLSRARAKAYVAQLEKTVSDLTKPSTAEPSANVTKQLREQFEEIERLKSIILGIGKLTQGAAGSNPASSPSDHQSLRELTTGNVSDGGWHVSELPDDFDDDQINSAGPSDKGLENQLVAGFGQNAASIASNTSVSMLRAENTLLQSRSEWMYTHLFCGEGNRNYFEAIDSTISKVLLSDNRRPFLGAEEDDDLTIRAVFHGWQAARKAYEFDLVWQFLEALDQGLWYRGGLVERVAVLRILRALLVTKMRPAGQQLRLIPAYMHPTETQTLIEHPVVVDYFVWPAVRDHLILTSSWYTAETDSATYAQSLRFVWKYGVRDICKQDAATGRYSFSMEFDKSYNDLRSWQSYYEGPSICPPNMTPEIAFDYTQIPLPDDDTSLSVRKGSGSFLDEEVYIGPSATIIESGLHQAFESGTILTTEEEDEAPIQNANAINLIW